MTDRDWAIQQPALADMRSPVVCLHCHTYYDLGFVKVTARYVDCSVWTSPCCGFPGIDDRPWVRDRHYREISRKQAASPRRPGSFPWEVDRV